MSKENEEQYFQWKKGDFYGNIETVDKEITLGDVTYLVFKSGKQLNKAVIDEFAVQLESPDMPLVDTSINPFAAAPVSTSITPTNEFQQAEQDTNKVTNLGKADAIPHPSETEKVKQFNNKQKAQSPHLSQPNQAINPFTANIPDADTVPAKPKSNPVAELINKAKKETFELELTIKVKLPVKGFFALLDDDFIDTNRNNILNEMINKIKREDLDTQLKENLINIYNIQELCTTTKNDEK